MRPLAKKSLPVSPPSAPAAPELASYQGLTFGRERLAHIAQELPPLFARHHAELAVEPKRAPLAPDWDRYFELDLLGVLHILTARDGPALVGYVFNLIGPHMHKRSTRWCHVDMYWLDPGYRVGWGGVKLLRENEKLVKALGARKIIMVEKAHFHNADGRKVGVLLKRMGYAVEDIAYGKWIGD